MTAPEFFSAPPAAAAKAAPTVCAVEEQGSNARAPAVACEDCAAAAREPWRGFMASCRGCCARALARSPHFRRVRDSGMQDRAYRSALQQFGLTHEEVREAVRKDKEHAKCP